jgi:hypothetical protein
MSRHFIKIDTKVGLNPREADVFKHAVYFECDRFNYTYSSAVNSYNYAHNGTSKNSHLSGKVVSEEEWTSIVTQLRNLVTDKYIRLIKVNVFYWNYDPDGAGHFESGFTFKYGDDIIAYSVWDFVNKSGEFVTRITDDGYMI